MGNSNFDEILYVVEKAVDQHAKLQRKSQASIMVTRGPIVFTVRVDARRRGSKRLGTMTADGDTPEEAANNLIEGLDYWAGTLK